MISTARLQKRLQRGHGLKEGVTIRVRSRWGLALLVFFAVSRGFAGEPSNAPPRRYQNTPDFALTFESSDPDIECVALELYDENLNEWREVGKFSIRRVGDKSVGGKAIFRAEREGTYLLRARARDKAGNLDPKGPHADVVAIYDKTPPAVEIVAPSGPLAVAPLSELIITWKTQEPNPLPGGGASLEVSLDAGRSWKELASGIDDRGSYSFKVGRSRAKMLVRVIVRDACGNRGEAVTPVIAVEKLARTVQARERHQEGLKALSAGQFVKAVKLLREAIAADAGLEAVWLDLSAALACAGELKKAADVLERATRRWPSSGTLQYNLGLVRLRSGRLEDARAALEKACQMEPSRYEAHWVLALLALESGDLELARTHWRELVQAAPEDSELRARSLKYLAASERR